MTTSQIVRETLQQARDERRNLGQPPAKHSDPVGWVAGNYFANRCGVLRYGARIFEMRRDGLKIETHTEAGTNHVTGRREVHSFYRLQP